MSTFEQLLASVGIGAARLTIAAVDRTYARGSLVSGELAVEGGTVEQYVERLTVTLAEFMHKGKSQERRDVAALELARGLTAVPGDHRAHPFQLLIPDDARLTRAGSSDGWQLLAEADILWAVNPRAHLDLTIVPHREVMAIDWALRRLGFNEAPFHFDIPVFSIEPEAVTVHYRAPEELRDQLDGLTLRARVSDQWVRARLTLNRRQHGLREHVMALAGGDREEHEIAIPRSDLLTPSGEPRPEGAEPHVMETLRMALALPGDDARRLLRPASAPGDAGRLLRPAGPAREEDEARLPRPADRPGEGE